MGKKEGVLDVPEKVRVKLAGISVITFGMGLIVGILYPDQLPKYPGLIAAILLMFIGSRMYNKQIKTHEEKAEEVIKE